MRKALLSTISAFCAIPCASGQPGPAITSWLQNTTETGSYYMSGNSTAISNGILVNCQRVEYSSNWVYVHATGVPSYPTGPFLDGNPSQAADKQKLVRIPLNPVENTGTKTPTSLGAIGIFINGVSIFDYADGGGWNHNTNSLCGGAGYQPCPPGATLYWRKDAVVAERHGFDCSKGHPAQGEYHHHQNPSAFKLDLNVVSNICNLYDADGLYVIDSTQHSPLIGYAFDGFPVYGAYGYMNADGTGGIARMKSGYQLRNISQRTHHADGTDVPDGPAVNSTYPLGLFREDYEFVAHPGEDDYLDIHNGRFCITPEYPNGTYAYFATVDSNYNSAYPYVVGPTYYGSVTGGGVTSVSEPTTVYTPSLNTEELSLRKPDIHVFPNPASDLIAIQVGSLVTTDMKVELTDLSGKRVSETKINKGQTIAYFDVQTVYEGIYLVRISAPGFNETRKIVIRKD
mgnify:CR=1 FL=1